MGNNLDNSSAFVLINSTQKNVDIEFALSAVNEIAELHFVTGNATYLAKVSAADNSAIGRLVGQMNMIEGVESVQTLVVLETITAVSQPSDRVGFETGGIWGLEPPYKRFLKGLVDIGVARSPHIHGNMRVRSKPFIRATGSILRGLYNYYYSGTSWGRVELYIDRGTRQENKEIFDRLYESKDAIESEFGKPINWARLDDKRACRISYIISSGGYRDPEGSWGEIQKEMVEAMTKLEAAIRPFIIDLRNQYS